MFLASCLLAASVFAAPSAEDVKAGDVITEQNVRSVRPGYGLHPKYLPEILGKKFVKDCQMGESFSLEMVIG